MRASNCYCRTMMEQKEELNQEKVFAAIQRVETEVNRVVVGQDWLIRRLLIGLFSEIPYSFKRDGEEKTGYGHVLLEGVPGLAKTLTVMTLASTLSAKISAHSVYSRPAAGGHHRHADLRPGGQFLPHRKGADLCQFDSCG